MASIDIPRPAFFDDEEFGIFADSVGRFFDEHATPAAMARWREGGVVDRSIWEAAGAAGMLGVSIPTRYGGAGGDFRHELVMMEEGGKRGVEGFALNLHNTIIAPYILESGTEEQRQRWLPGICSGEFITAIAMTEPDAGSDLQGIKTQARRDGDDFVISGQKTYISNGQLANLIVVACKTDPDRGAAGISLIVVETDKVTGFQRGRNLDKIGRESQDTSELFFDAVRVPSENVIGGEPNRGFFQMMEKLPQERLVLALGGMTVIERAIRLTTEYVRERKAFGRPIFDFQNTQFKLAEAKAEASVCKVFLNWCVEQLLAGKLDTTTASIAKLVVTEAECRIVDNCLQLHGGFGYMNESAIARMYKDSRIQRIHGGTSEIMKLVIARTL